MAAGTAVASRVFDRLAVANIFNGFRVRQIHCVSLFHLTFTNIHAT